MLTDIVVERGSRYRVSRIDRGGKARKAEIEGIDESLVSVCASVETGNSIAIRTTARLCFIGHTTNRRM